MPLSLQLIDIRIPRINFQINSEYKEEEKNKLSFRTDIGIRHDFIEKNNELFLFVRLRQLSGNVPYFFEVEGSGHFKFNITPDAKTLDAFVNINCPAIIFPYIRETVADITRRGGFPPLHVGPINFIELAKSNKKKTEL